MSHIAAWIGVWFLVGIIAWVLASHYGVRARGWKRPVFGLLLLPLVFVLIATSMVYGFFERFEGPEDL